MGELGEPLAWSQCTATSSMAFACGVGNKGQNVGDKFRARQTQRCRPIADERITQTMPTAKRLFAAL